MSTELLTTPPGEVIRQILVDGSFGTIGGTIGGTSGSSSDWPIYTPITVDEPDNVIIIKDTAGILQQRRMPGGGQTYRPGIQVMVRARKYDDGWEKIDRIKTYLDESVGETTVVVGAGTADTHKVHAWTRTSGPIPLGQESEGRRLETSAGASKRYRFTLNGTISITEL